jgi:hypothetical protein
MAPLQDEGGRLFTMFADAGDEWRHEPVAPTRDGRQPDLETALGRLDDSRVVVDRGSGAKAQEAHGKTR